ncbi:MAG: hypothetical protein HOI15_01190 [Opitutales bacterium]|nr:hypothetical protein [Opitutales bacterium]MBT5812955.1 hypothetical protein [Opitutales bacterium]
MGKILELGQLLQIQPNLKANAFEAHPEVHFKALNNDFSVKSLEESISMPRGPSCQPSRNQTGTIEFPTNHSNQFSVLQYSIISSHDRKGRSVNFTKSSIRERAPHFSVVCRKSQSCF